ncbi:hypothetical protein JL108_07015 [Aeromicrobium sp. YIM 150415]|uniref:hypothetical protein n=1 Tax=Aeromicrobium sp. YIM 150415 TaxID=2803912 RepID=UPI001963B518|nr:hypothetical protein [Aeromicrobium sp. YIM 150415]MBM9461846.1 hypothetical protein [Aeromicrobium sp. YIM 150415]MBM9463194.1 hypothetical protein [Aeromicrobium sp. YIM 150415]
MTRETRRSGGILRPARANYVLIRGTGILLVFLALGHFALTHIITDVADTGSDFIARRWADIGWVVWDGALLFAALAHSAAGLAALVRDYRPGRARVAYVFILGVLMVFLCLGLATLVLHQLR